MSGKKKEAAKPLRQIITADDISWVKNSQQTEINKISGDEILAAKSAHSARRFKQSMVYQARRTNVNTHKKHFQEELDFHSKRYGWWQNDYDGPHIKNIDEKWHYTR